MRFECQITLNYQLIGWQYNVTWWQQYWSEYAQLQLATKLAHILAKS